MIMEVSRDVILDLLPLYLADEASPDTSALIEKYFDTDPDFREMAERFKTAMSLPGNIPVPLTEEDKLRSYRKSRWQLFFTILAVVFMVSAVVGATLFVFLLGM
jgi:hypothetical protein